MTAAWGPLLLVAALLAPAQDGEFDTVAAAATRIAAVYREADARGAPPPHRSDADLAAPFRTVTDIAGIRRLPLNLGRLLGTCRALHDLTAVVLADHTLGRIESVQDEAALIMSSDVACVGQTLRAADAFVQALEPDERTAPRRQGVIQAQQGMVQMINGLLTYRKDPIVKPANRTLIANAITEDVGVIGAMLNPTQRAELAGLLRRYAEDDANAAILRDAAARLSTAPCGPLCAFSTGE